MVMETFLCREDRADIHLLIALGRAFQASCQPEPPRNRLLLEQHWCRVPSPGPSDSLSGDAQAWELLDSTVSKASLTLTLICKLFWSQVFPRSRWEMQCSRPCLQVHESGSPGRGLQISMSYKTHKADECILSVCARV